tara:strand:- start:358 stop:552 length:195 start_codon:yes stop_codon:yes gene_type:complete
MLKYLLVGFGLMLLIEGILYFFFTIQMQDMMKIMTTMDKEKIKSISALLSIIGVCLIYFTIKYY